MMNWKKNEVMKLNKSRAKIVSTVKLTNRLQSSISPVEIELNKNFKQIVVTETNPAIKLAKTRRTSYTIAKGLEIIEVKGTKQNVIGTVLKSDISLAKGMVYKLIK